MITKKQNIFVWCIYILMTVMVIASFFGKFSSQLTVSYLSQTNQNGRGMAFFTISNAGSFTVACNSRGILELPGQNATQTVSLMMPFWELPPENCVTSQVYLPVALQPPWRLSISYQRTGFKSWTKTSSEWIK